MSKIDDFIAKYLPFAQQASAKSGINTDVILAQAALESAYGASAPNNNFFGIKGKGGVQTTKEFIGGKWVTISDSFRGYKSPADSFAGYADFITGKRYTAARQTTDSAAQISAIHRAGYATDPNYSDKVGAIAAQIRQKMGTNFSGLNVSGSGFGRDALNNVLGGKVGNAVSDGLVSAGGLLAAPGNAVEGAIASVTPDFNSWFQRIALVVFALLFIAAAIFTFKGGDVVATMKGAVA